MFELGLTVLSQLFLFSHNWRKKKKEKRGRSVEKARDEERKVEGRLANGLPVMGM